MVRIRYVHRGLRKLLRFGDFFLEGTVFRCFILEPVPDVPLVRLWGSIGTRMFIWVVAPCTVQLNHQLYALFSKSSDFYSFATRGQCCQGYMPSYCSQNIIDFYSENEIQDSTSPQCAWFLQEYIKQQPTEYTTKLRKRKTLLLYQNQL